MFFQCKTICHYLLVDDEIQVVAEKSKEAADSSTSVAALPLRADAKTKQTAKPTKTATKTRTTTATASKKPIAAPKTQNTIKNRGTKRVQQKTSVDNDEPELKKSRGQKGCRAVSLSNHELFRLKKRKELCNRKIEKRKRSQFKVCLEF